MNHPEFQENSGGGGIAGHAHRGDAMEFEVVESVANHGAACLAGVAVSPVGDADPVAEFGLLMFRLEHEANASAELAAVAEGDGEPEFVGLARVDEEVAGVSFGIGVSDAQSCGGNFSRAQQCH